jgi:hypothetical protein
MRDYLFIDKELQLLALRTKSQLNWAHWPDTCMWASTNGANKLRTQRSVSGGLGGVVDQHIKFKVATVKNGQMGKKVRALTRCRHIYGLVVDTTLIYNIGYRARSKLRFAQVCVSEVRRGLTMTECTLYCG